MAPRALQASTAPQLVPNASEVVRAVESLYEDELRPMGRILLRRLRELAAEAQAAALGLTVSDADVEAMGLIDPRYLRSLCETCPELVVLPADGKEYAVELRHSPRGVFVDPGSARDPYAGSMWAAFATYIMDLDEASSTWPSGRYACAQMLRSRNVPCLKGLSLGELCHIVQLAISQKKILGYASGHTVQYHRSDEYIKLRCAVRQQPLELAEGDLPFASWSDVCRGLVELLETSTTPMPGMLSVSNVKRLFRAQLSLELSETVLGHSKIGDLLQDPRLSSICSVQGVGSGQAVVVANYLQAAATTAQASGPIPQSSYFQQWQPHSAGVTLCAPVNHSGSASQVCLSTCASTRGGSAPATSPISSTTPGTMATTLFSTSPCQQPQSQSQPQSPPILASSVPMPARELTVTSTMSALSSLPIATSASRRSMTKASSGTTAAMTTLTTATTTTMTTTTTLSSSPYAAACPYACPGAGSNVMASTSTSPSIAKLLGCQDGASTTASAAYSNEEVEEAQKAAMLAFEACGRSHQGSNYGYYGDAGSVSTERHDGSDSSCSSIHFQSYFYPGCQGYYYQSQSQYPQSQYQSQSPPLSFCCPSSPPRSIAEVSEPAVAFELEHLEEQEHQQEQEDQQKQKGEEKEEAQTTTTVATATTTTKTKHGAVMAAPAMAMPALTLPPPLALPNLVVAKKGDLESVEVMEETVSVVVAVAKNEVDDQEVEDEVATEDEVTTEDGEEDEEDEAASRAEPAFETYGLVVKNGFLDEAPRRSYFRHCRSRSL